MEGDFFLGFLAGLRRGFFFEFLFLMPMRNHAPPPITRSPTAIGIIGALPPFELEDGITGAALGESVELPVGVGSTVGVVPPLPSAPGRKEAVVRGSGMELVSTSSTADAEVSPSDEVATT